MPATAQAHLKFLPWVRQGAAAAITAPDSLGASQPGAASVDVTLRVNDRPLPKTTVQLRGPADVLGIDPHQIVRADPRPGSKDFEPNCFASIEFDRADFPWLFTPARANADGKLRPWLTLVVVRKQDGVSLLGSADGPLPVLQVAAPARPWVELPDLVDAWAWAHAQVASQDDGADAVQAALGAAPELSLSRLVCPRVLAPDSDYIACVVPAYELGRKAGLGLAVADSDLKTLAPAWSLGANTPTLVQLPVYHSWEFSTGADGDFAALAGKLTGGSPAGLGRRTVRIGAPGFTLPDSVPASATTAIEGALAPYSGNADPASWSDAIAHDFEKALADVVNLPGLNEAATPGADPLLAPPLYGRWHAARALVNPGAANWFDELNLDPRWRVVAAIGTQVVQEQQEALMASAWEQAAAMPQANQRMRQLQLSMAVGESLHARHLVAIANLPVDNEEMLLRVAAPALSRLYVRADNPQGPTLMARMAATSLPVPATRTAMRRLGRQRGPLTRRIAAQGFPRAPESTWVARLNDGITPAARPAPTFARLAGLPSVADVTAAVWNRGFQIAAEGQPLVPLPDVDLLPGDWDYPGYFRSAVADHLSRLRPPPQNAVHSHVAMSPTASLVLAQMHPRAALARLARAAVATGDNVLQPTAPGVAPVGVETLLMAPSFPQAMIEPLKDLSQDLLLPGLETVKPETVLGLQTNRAFIEAYMVGLNAEMGRELLWRGFPTDQQGTYFRSFWGEGSADIDDLRLQPGRVLGAAATGAAAQQFVLLLRSRLLRRYPNALIYLSPIAGTGPDVLPSFTGAMDPDVSFFGFPVAPAAAAGNGSTTGYFVIIQEHPTEPRFGIDADTMPPGHLVIARPPPGAAASGYTWGLNGAHMAAITRRRLARVAIRAAQLIPST